MFVIKRNGKREPVKFDKVTARIEKLSYSLSPLVNVHEVAKKTIEGIYDGVPTTELDNLAAETAASLTTVHPDYALLASRIAVSNLHKNTIKSFSSCMRKLYNYIDGKTGRKMPLIADDVMEIIESNADLLDSTIIYDRDYSFDYFGFRTLEKSYLLRVDGKIAERPQHMYMRVAVGIHKHDLLAVIKTYHLMSEKWYTHATPTLFNAGTPKPQMSSCFLLTMKEDSIDGIYDTLKQTAKISQSAGGIGLAIHNIRATGSYISGTNGSSNGIIPMLRVFNDTARYVDQGGGKRKGAFAIYLEPWHADADGPVTQVRVPRLFNGIVVVVDYFVEALCGFICYFVQFFMIELSVDHKTRQRDGCKIAHCHFIGRCVFHDLRTKIAAFNSSHILLVALAVGRIFI